MGKSFVHPMKAHQPTTTVHRAVPGNAPVPRTLGQPTIFVPNQTRQHIIEEPLTRAPVTRICYTCNKLVQTVVEQQSEAGGLFSYWVLGYGKFKRFKHSCPHCRKHFGTFLM